MEPERRIVELTKDLIRIPSTHSRPAEIKRCADWIEQWLLDNSLDYKRFDYGGTPSILALPANQRTKILLMAHFDVVEAEDLNLFDPVEADGRLYGRGAIDDKYAVAFIMVLFASHVALARQNAGGQTDLPFGILLTGDEEVGGFNGAAKAITHVKPDYVIALDGGNPDLIVTKEKGILQLDLTATGKAAHAARPWLGESAFDMLVEDYLAIRQIFNEDAEDHWHKTMVLGNCRAGDGSVNKLPGTATATLDIRYTEKDDPDRLVEKIQSMVRCTVTVKAKEPLFTGGTSAFLDLLVAHSGAEVGFEHGASDARFLTRLGIPGAVWGADGEMSQHTPDEHVVIASIGKLYRSLDHYLTTIAKW